MDHQLLPDRVIGEIHDQMADIDSIDIYGDIPSGAGFDCEFVDSIPESLSCPVCLLPFRDPHLVDCCGAKYCAMCIGRVEAFDQPCPVCRQHFNKMLDKNEQRKVLDLKVRCSEKNKGCEWVGELRCLNSHVSETCGWTEVLCNNDCGQRVFRYRQADHEQDECPQRSVDAKVDNLMRDMELRHSTELMTKDAEMDELRREMEKKTRAHIAEMESFRMKRNAQMFILVFVFVTVILAILISK